MDFNDLMGVRTPIVFAFVLGLAFLLMLVTFHSIVIPIKAILLNLLSVAAAYGILVAIFQHGIGQNLIGFNSTGTIANWLPLFLFVVLFGLSMDYHVFILSRVKELVDGGMPTDEAVSVGIRSTAGVVTSAAVVMVGVFALFGTLSVLDVKQFGVGAAIAVLPRRDHRAGGAAAGHDEAAGRVELVHAPQPGLAAPAAARGPGPRSRPERSVGPTGHQGLSPQELPVGTVPVSWTAPPCPSSQPEP